jgi:hypothetical protein
MDSASEPFWKDYVIAFENQRNYIFESRLQLPLASPLLQAAGRRLLETKYKTICFFEMPIKN